MVTNTPKLKITRKWIRGIKVKYCGKRLTPETHTGARSWYLCDEQGADPIEEDERSTPWIIDYEKDYCGRSLNDVDWIVICRDCYQNAGFEW